MKMQKEHYTFLSTSITSMLANKEITFEKVRKDYEAADLSEQRLRWDLLWACNISNWISDELYTYLNDDHIDTALRNIVKSL